MSLTCGQPLFLPWQCRQPKTGNVKQQFLTFNFLTICINEQYEKCKRIRIFLLNIHFLINSLVSVVHFSSPVSSQSQMLFIVGTVFALLLLSYHWTAPKIILQIFFFFFLATFVISPTDKILYFRYNQLLLNYYKILQPFTSCCCNDITFC